MKKSPTKELAEFQYSLSFNEIPDVVVDNAKRCILDTIGCAIGGSRSSEVHNLVHALMGNKQQNGSLVWGFATRFDVFSATLLNGIMAHTLELDDVHRGAKAHAGTVVVPAALTFGEAYGITGKELITAVVCGYDVMLRIACGIGALSHRKRGWHATGTCGTFGSAAAAGKILGLGMEQFIWALGLAGTQSSGLWAFTADGASNKKLHAGKAAESGIISALFAKAGMSGPSRILDAEDGGLFVATSDEYDLETVIADLGKRFFINEVSVKPYACCRSMHPAIEAAILLKKKYDLKPSMIKKVLLRTYSVALMQCGLTKRPKTTVEAQFNLAHGIAVALMDGRALVEQFSETRIQDETLLELASKVELVVDSKFERLYPNNWGCYLEVELTNNEILFKEVISTKGDPENPFSQKELEDKFVGLVEPVIGRNQSQLVLELISSLEEIENIHILIKNLKYFHYLL